MKYKQCRKNGGFIWHWVAIEGSNRGDALCGETTVISQKKSYWVGNSNLVTDLGQNRFCKKCKQKKETLNESTFIASVN